MLSQQQNPPQDSQPLPQSASSHSLAQPEKHPFSIRQHVLACRQKDVISNWPFPLKYLNLCLSRGIKEVLPPLESHKAALQSIRGVVRLNSSQQEDKDTDLIQNKSLDTVVQENECECILNTEPSISELSVQYFPSSPSNRNHQREENETNLSLEVASSSIFIRSTDQPSAIVPSSQTKNGFSPPVASSSSVVVSTDQPSTSIQTTTTLSSIRKLSRKERRRNSKLMKKRTMTDILDVAKPCTSEDLLRIKKLCCLPSNPLEPGGEGMECIIDDENKSDLTKDYSSEKVERNCDEANVSMQSRPRLVVKFNFSGCQSDV